MSRRSGVMLATAFNLSAIEKRWKFPIAVQPKLNGFRGRSEWMNGHYNMLSSESNIFTSVPHINRALDKQIMGIHPDGEIYQHGRKLTGPNGIMSIVKQQNQLHPDYEQMEYHIFDLINEKDQKSRLNFLDQIEFKWPLVRVPSHIVYSISEVFDLCEMYCDRGYEGIILRQLDVFYRPTKVVTMMKLKPTKDDYYEIINFKEEISIEGYGKNRLGSVQCVDKLGETFRVGSGFDDYDRESLWKNPENLIGKFCHVKYQELTHRGVPTPPVVLKITDTNLED